MNNHLHISFNGFMMFRILIGISAAILLIWSILPLLAGLWNTGIMASIPVALSVLAACVFWEPLQVIIRKIWAYKAGCVILSITAAVILSLLVLFVFVSILMFNAAYKKPAEQATVLVLGAQINGDYPSLMLAERLDAAANYLEKNENATCIVSGGQGADEKCSEALVMHNYLIAQGIDPSRIYQEARSTNTEENIRYSMEIIEQEGLSSSVVIATQEFHQYRAQAMAKEAGYADVSPCTCSSPIYFLECYWVREFAAVCRFWFLGY